MAQLSPPSDYDYLNDIEYDFDEETGNSTNFESELVPLSECARTDVISSVTLGSDPSSLENSGDDGVSGVYFGSVASPKGPSLDDESTSESNISPLSSPRIHDETPLCQECARTDVPASVKTHYANIRDSPVTFGSYPSPEGPSLDDGSTSQSNVIQLSSPRIHDETPTQDDFDPKKFDPTNLSFKETYDVLSKLDLDKHIKFIRDTILQYSLSLCGFPACHDEDLMIAVYFYFEKRFKIQAKLEFCARFDYHNNKNLVGVLLDSIHTKKKIFEKAAKMRCTDIKIWENFAFHWILNDYNGPRRRT